MPRVRTEPRGLACRAETGANLADAKYLGRCKLRLLELLLAQGLDAVFVDPGVLVLSPLYLERLVRMGRDLAVGSAWPSVREVATTLSPPACPVPSATPRAQRHGACGPREATHPDRLRRRGRAGMETTTWARA